jgi:RNA polymerase sigma factor (sigma-70 family)
MENQEFDSLNVYIDLAKKTISKFAGSLKKEMLSNEDAVSDVASAIMIGDWKWDANRKGKTGKSKTRYSYRNQCAIWAIQTYTTKKYKAPKSRSLNYANDSESGQVGDIISSSIKDPCEIAIEKEYSENLSKDIRDILNSELISDKQRQYIELYYFEGYTLEKIGKRFNITREAVRQNINKSLEKIKNLADV